MQKDNMQIITLGTDGKRDKANIISNDLEDFLQNLHTCAQDM